MKRVVAVFLSLIALQAYSQTFNDRSTTGPKPPKGVDVTGYIPNTKAVTVQVQISGVPVYLWKDGCGPTVIGMLAGYYDLHGFPDIMPGDASSQTSAVNAAIASTEHYNDYAKPLDTVLPVYPDKSEAPVGDEHINNSIADFMSTSFSIKGNIYGWSKGVDIKPAWENWIEYFSPDYIGSANEYYYNSSTWDTLVSNIDKNKPMLLLVDTNSDGLTDHFVIADGYRIDSGVKYFGCYNTWDSNHHWYAFAQMANGVAWGVARCYTFQIHHKLPVAAGTITGATDVCTGQLSVEYTVPPIDDATSYIWTLPSGASGNSTTNSILVNYGAGAVSGNISVKGHNDNGDGAASYLAVTVRPLPSTPVTGTVTQPTCLVPSGSISLSGLPATGTWTLTVYPSETEISGTGTSYTVSSLGEGSYSFSVRLYDGCPSGTTPDITIEADPGTPSAPVPGTITNPTCSVATGSVYLDGLPSSGTWTIIMSPGNTQVTGTGTSRLITGIAAGTYTFTVSAVSGCVSLPSGDVVINNQPETPANPSVTLTQPACSVATGTITINSPAGTGITYSINGSDYSSTTGIFTGVAAGTYPVTAKSSDGCISGITSVTLNPQPPTPATPSVTLTQTTCSAATGTITVTSPTGTGMTYSINGTTYVNTTGIFSNVTPGTYTVTAKNLSGCISSGRQALINDQPPTPASPTLTLIQPTCNTGTGTITITAPTGTGMTYSINGSTYVNTTGVFSNVAPGTYTVTAKNSSGCISPGMQAVINDQPPTPATPAISLIQPTCLTGTGTITITSPTGIGMTYSINGSTYVNTSGVFSNVTPGNYTVTAKNSSGCISSGRLAVINDQPPTPASPAVSLSQPTCSVATGTITITSPTGVGMTYSINGTTWVNTTGVFSNVTPGTYTVTAKNSSGCVSEGTQAIINDQPPTPSTPTLSLSQPTCLAETGTITITSPTGIGMTYSINGTSYVNTTGVFSNIAPGTYTVTAKNSAGCISSVRQAVINDQPPVPAAPSFTLTQPTCSIATGTITITSPTGVGMTYSINGTSYFNTTGVFSNVIPGTYTVTARNSSGCISEATQAIINDQPPTPATPTLSLIQPTCSSGTGTITISSPTGIGMTYSINGTTYVNTSGVFSNVTPGNYNVTAMNSYGCISSVRQTVINDQPPTPVAPVVMLTQPTCSVSRGTIVVTTPEETGMTYSITGIVYVNTSGVFNNVSPGNYTVTAKNSAGCISQGTEAVIDQQPETPATPVITLIDETLFSSSATGNSWYNDSGPIEGATGSSLDVSENGNYYVIVTLNGCSSAPSNQIAVVITGIDPPDQGVDSFRAWPNPFHNQLTIEADANEKVLDIDIINSLGVIILKDRIKNSVVIDGTLMKQGIYFIRITDGISVRYLKVIKR